MAQNKNKIIQKLRVFTDTRVWGLMAFGVVALLVTWSGIKVVQTNYELEKKISVARQENSIAQLEADNLRLKNKYYESSQYLELTTRRQFGKAAPGERLYTVPESVALLKTVESQIPPDVAAQQASVKPKYQQNFDDWMQFLLHAKRP
jgi:cell division protein FtsB